MRLSDKIKGYIALVLTSILWGTTWVVSKIGLTGIPALQMACYRQFISGALFVLYFMCVKKYSFPRKEQYVWLLMMAVLTFVFANAFSTWSVKYIPAGLGALIGALYPLCVVIIERIFYKSEKVKPLTILGFLVGLAGISVVFYDNAFNSQHSSAFYFGVILSVIAMISWSLGTVFIVRNKLNMNPYYATGWQMVFSSFILLPIAYLLQPTVSLVQIPLVSWGAIVYLVFFGSVITFIAFIYSMKVLPMSLASSYAYFNPIVALLTAAWVLGEQLTWDIFWGTLVTLSGVFLVNFSLHIRRPLIENEM